MPSKVQLIGGLFQDSEGNALANGYLKFKLSQDGAVPSVGSICAGVEVTVKLNSSGSVDTSTPQYIWGDDQILPANTFYKVTGYAANGQPAWGPNNQQVIGNGGTFDVGTWIPNQVFSWTPPLTTTLMKTNGVANSIQTVLNLIGSGVSASGGDVTVKSAASYADIDVTSAGEGGTYFVSAAQAQNSILRISGTQTTSVTLKFPSVTPGMWLVTNFTTANLTLTTTDLGASSVTFNTQQLVYADGSLDVPGIQYVFTPETYTFNIPYVVGKPAGGLKQVIALSNPGANNAQLYLRTDGTGGSPLILCDVAPTSNAVFTFEASNNLGVSWVTWGTCTVTAGNKVATTLTGVTSLNNPDFIRVTYPAVQDATMSGVAVSVHGNYSNLPH